MSEIDKEIEDKNNLVVRFRVIGVYIYSNDQELDEFGTYEEAEDFMAMDNSPVKYYRIEKMFIPIN